MTSPEIEKGVDLRETSAEKPLETQESERLPTFSKIQSELEAATDAGLKAGHRTLENLEGQEQASTEFPPELKAQFAEIQKEAEGKLRCLDVSIGRTKERFLSIVNFLTGDVFERMRRNPAEKNKFFTGHYLDRNNQGIGRKERGKLESQVNIGSIRERALDAGSYLSNKIRNNDVVLLGEIHTHETIEKRAVADFLKQAKIAGTTHVGLEIPEYYQETVDHFMATGKFDDADDPADYEQVDEYHRLFREQLARPKQPKQVFELQKDESGKYKKVKPEGMTDEMFEFEQKMRGNFVFRNHFDKDYRLLKGVREAELLPVCLDANATYGTNQELDDGMEAIGRGEMTLDGLRAKEKKLEEQRDVFMAQKIQGVVEGGGKMLAVLGNNHVARKGMEGRQNVADLLGETDLQTSSINIDRDCDSDLELSFLRRQEQQPDSSANSVLFSVIGKDETFADRSIGFNLHNNITGQNTPAPYEGYIRLAKSL